METIGSSLSFGYETEIESAYVITIKGHELSERMASRCEESCRAVEMPYRRWDAFDGTKGDIVVPESLRGQDWVRWIRVVNEALAKTEVCTVLSHVSLWARCVEIDRPIVALEHDAVVLRRVTHHPAFNAISYLGSIEQVQSGYWGSIPIHGQMNRNYRFQLRTHAYSVDPFMARRLLASIVKSGVATSIDVMIRSDIYTILQFGIFAYDQADGVSTAPEKDDKKKDQRLTRINNKII